MPNTLAQDAPSEKLRCALFLCGSCLVVLKTRFNWLSAVLASLDCCVFVCAWQTVTNRDEP